MWEKILPWIGGIFAAVGLILIFYDVILTIKRRDKTKTNIIGLVLLSVSVVGYLITDIILPAVKEDNEWPALASFAWIVLFWVYVLLDAITMMGDIRFARRAGKSHLAAAAQNERQSAEQEATEQQSVEQGTVDQESAEQQENSTAPATEQVDEDPSEQ